MSSIIKVSGVCRDFGSFRALNNINAEFPKGKLSILKGRSGSGKTTLLNILGALDQPTEGKVLFEYRNIVPLTEKERTLLRRRHTGFVFQSVALVPMMSALENVEFALRLSHYKGNHRERAMECLGLVGLTSRAQHLPQELSGGEQQRVAIARAIAHRPLVIFADEPTGALDTDSGLRVVKLFKDLIASEGVSVIMTTHDPGLMQVGDKVFEIEDGALKENGSDN